MQKFISFIIVVVLSITATSSFAQKKEKEDKSETKSVLTEQYKQSLQEVIAFLQIGNQDVDKYMAMKVDSLLRICYMADAENLLATQQSRVMDGVIQRPKLVHDKVDGRAVFKKRTIKAYDNGFRKFLKSLPRNVRYQYYDEFVVNNSQIVMKPKMALIKEYKTHLKVLLDVK